ncbi:MAG: NAD+ synthase [bacterium]
MHNFRLALAQINPTVGDLKGNARRIRAYLQKARRAGADLVAFPELALTGYPPEDLLLKPFFIEDNVRALESLAEATRGITAVVGFVDKDHDIYNAAALLQDGKWVGTYRKNYLPNYGVFDESRYFQRGDRTLVFVCQGVRVGLSICEDIWQPTGPLAAQVLCGNAELAVNISASPFYAGRRSERLRMLSTRAMDHTVALAYVNLVGGQDELIFDGNSLVLDERGRLLGEGKPFCEDLLMTDLNVRNVFRARLLDPRRREERRASQGRSDPVEVLTLPPLPQTKSRLRPLPAPAAREALGDTGEIFHALVLGIRDYLGKNGFEQAVVGLSGGVDSSITAALAVEALGRKNVHGIFMPTRYSSELSRLDAEALARDLGISFRVIPIDPIFAAFLEALQPAFRGSAPDQTEENLQARIRGTVLMAFSNKFNWIVLNTGNKSETSVGYCTLYGDMAGGLAVLKDVPKTTVYALCEYLNRVKGREVISRSVLEKAPSAELRPNQTDQDSLPPYEELDAVLHLYVERDYSLEEILQSGFPRDRVRDIMRRVDRNEYKRRQAPPGMKITPKAFGRDRRLPITNRYSY